MSYADLQDVFWIQNAGEFLKTNCTILSTNRPVVGMAWDFLQRGTFSPLIDDALRDNGAIVLKIEMQSKSIDVPKLSEEVARCLSNHSESNLPIIAKKLFCETLQNPEVDKIEENAASLLDYCSALVLPGGKDIEPEFYTNGQAATAQWDYRRSIAELAFLTYAHKRKMPIMGICRGSQMINVYFGGTLRQLPKPEMEWQYLSLSNSSKKEELQQWIGGTNIWALSMHHQACDKIGNNLEIIIEHEGIPKLLMSHDNQFIGVQFHPETYIVEDFIKERPEAIHNKGIYRLFFSKILQHHMLGV
ncbi:MAG TPA: gamma-glutamyl-gamma-aminobutyrate hydrolase family protein [Chlamydiales bacterium]|nr:gamma-glutamyl-gamma-aminobutyrate hydrolase family protein [Chlamydiales bacterium]